MLQILRAKFRKDYTPTHALDFGCGIGRVTYALTEHCDTVTGIDVAPAMIRTAQENGFRNKGAQVNFLLTTELAKCPDLTFDLLHSCLVFQHIRPARGFALLRKMLVRLEPGGMLCLQFPYANRNNKGRRMASWFKHRIPWLTVALARLRGYGHIAAPMEMNLYDTNQLLLHFSNAGVRKLFSHASESHGISFVTFYGQKQLD